MLQALAKSFVFLVWTIALSNCAYKLGTGQRSLPGGYKFISIPIFANQSQEPQVELYFTNSLKENFYRSKIGKITDKEYSEIELQGNIDSIQYLPGSKRVAPDFTTTPTPTANDPALPTGTALATEYRILVKITLKAIKRSDKSVIWQSAFLGERTYGAPQVTLAGVNSVDPLYNLSARRQNIAFIARDLMAEAHDRLTENF